MILQIGGHIEPLLPNGKQFTSDEFHEYKLDPKTTFLPPGIVEEISIKENIIQSPDNTFPASVGRVETLPFQPSRFMGIPVKGADVKQSNLYKEKSAVALECIESGATIDLLRGQSEAFFLSVIRVPDGWCEGKVKAVAFSPSASLHVGVGTPLKISAMQWLLSGPMGPFIGIVFAFAICVLVTVPFIALPASTLALRLTTVAMYPTLFGYAAFLAAWYSSGHPIVVRLVAITFLLAPTIVFLSQVRANTGLDRNVKDVYCFIMGLAAVCALVLFPYILLANGGGYWFSGYSFFPASWSTDNLLSMFEARSILLVGRVHPEALGTWSISDRGIVQPGTLLTLFSLPRIGRVLMEWPIGIYVQAMFASLLQGLVVPIVVVFLSRTRKVTGEAILMGIMLCTTPFIMFNIVYAWPKLSGGMLSVMSLLWFRSSLKTGNASSFCLSIFLFVLGVLNHSAALLMIVAFPCYMLLGGGFRILDWRNIQKAIFGAPGVLGLTVILSVGLLVWADSIEPKSSFTITFLVTGDGKFGLTKPEIWQHILGYVKSLSFAGFMYEKATDLLDLLWTTRPGYARDNNAPWSLAGIRSRQFLSLLPTLGPGMLAAVAVAAIRRSLSSGSAAIPEKRDSTILALGVSCMATLVAIIVLCGMPVIVHHLPYGIILGFTLLLMYFCRRDRVALSIGAVLQVMNLAIVWYYGAFHTWAEITSSAFQK